MAVYQASLTAVESLATFVSQHQEKKCLLQTLMKTTTVTLALHLARHLQPHWSLGDLP